MSEFTDTPEIPPPAPQPIPWERPGAGFGELISTVKMVITNPDGAFGRLPASNAVGRALVFGIVINLLANVIGQLWPLLMGASPQAVLEKLGVGNLTPVMVYAISLAVAPVLFLLGALIVSGIMHLMLLMLGGGPGGFSTTLRVYCYASVAALAYVIPFVGGLLSVGWLIVLLIVGLKAAHRITTGKSVAAVLIPFGLCCVCIIVLAVTFATALMTMMGGAGQ